VKLAAGTPLDVTLHWHGEDIQPVGQLGYRDGVAYLQYDERFLDADLQISPIHHRTASGLQRSHMASEFEGLHGVFHDSLPDGWGRLLLDRRARQLGIDPATLTPLDRLACVASGGIGGLCYAPAITPWGTGQGAVDLEALADDARLVLQGDVGQVLSALGRAGRSPGGARPKALVAMDVHGHAVHGRDDVPDDHAHYVVKFPGPGDPPDIAAIEMAYAVMAGEAGVAMAEARLVPGEDGRRYFASRRFDRDGGRRVHVHTASGLLYSDIRLPALDYKDLIMLTRSLTRDQRDCEGMFTLAVFNVLSHNRDDHARQFSFLMRRDGTWNLAPAYDLTWSSGPGGEHSSSVLGHGKDITRAHLLELGRQASMKQPAAGQVIERVRAAIGNWRTIANDHGVSPRSTDLIAQAHASVDFQP
jgi:serine/threonine-protein kinase HipA